MPDPHLTSNILREAVASAMSAARDNGYDLASMSVAERTDDLLDCDSDLEKLTHEELSPYVYEYYMDHRIRHDEYAHMSRKHLVYLREEAEGQKSDAEDEIQRIDAALAKLKDGDHDTQRTDDT